ncbi:MAG: Hsp20/alpha crystallin family protein [Spirochaetes bacterium]|nr:Hsp20/alpha crystallin family protein [Spirochaetota bacterium]
MNAELTKIKKDAYNNEEYVLVPPVDIYETENDFVVKAEMPGVNKDGVNITLDNNELEIIGKINGNLPDEKNLKYSEFNLYNYHRKFNVADTIDRNALKAGLDNGILTLTLPKKEEVKPKKIEVKVEN